MDMLSMNDIEFEKWRISYLEQQKKDRLLLQLDHDKIMQREKLAHETEIYKYKVEIQKLRAEAASYMGKSPARKSSNKTTTTYEEFSEEDRQFSAQTLFHEGKECHIGKLAKTPAYHASKNKADRLDKLFFNDSQFAKYKVLLDKEDHKKFRIRGLIHAILWAHSISARASKWPDAPDMDLVTKIQEEIMNKLSKYEAKPIQIVMDFLHEVWDKEVSDTHSIDVTLVGEYIDRVCEDYRKKRDYLDEVRMENSPFVKIMAEKLLEIDPEFKVELLVDHLRRIPLRNYIAKKKSDRVTFYVAHHYYKHIIHPFYKDTHDKLSWTKEHDNIAFELRRTLSEILDPLEAVVEDEYILYEAKRRERGVLDKIW